MKLEKITRDFIKTLTEPQKKRTKAYDTKGIVTRIEEGIAWVKLAGSNDTATAADDDFSRAGR